MSEARSWSDTSPCVADGRQDVVAVFVRSERGLAVIGGIDVRLAHQLPGKLTETHTPHCPFDKNSHWLGP